MSGDYAYSCITGLPSPDLRTSVQCSMTKQLDMLGNLTQPFTWQLDMTFDLAILAWPLTWPLNWHFYMTFDLAILTWLWPGYFSMIFDLALYTWLLTCHFWHDLWPGYFGMTFDLAILEWPLIWLFWHDLWPGHLSAFVISKTDFVSQKPCGKQLNAEVYGSRSVIFRI